MSVQPKYSEPEIERRWLVDLTLVDDLSALPYKRIEDLYISRSRLRLRKITDSDGDTTYKMGKKYGKRSDVSEPVTNLYITESEYRQLAALPGMTTIKRRYAVAGGALDVYQRPHAGLAIFEANFEDEAAARAYRPPLFAMREITADAAFSGAALAQARVRDDAMASA